MGPMSILAPSMPLLASSPLRGVFNDLALAKTDQVGSFNFVGLLLYQEPAWVAGRILIL